MYLHSNQTVIIAERPQGFQFSYWKLICLSLLTVSAIIFIYQFQLGRIETDNFKAIQLKVDRRLEPHFEEKFKKLIKELPALPLDFLRRNGYRSFKFSNGCAQFPDIFSLEFHNNFWQTFYLKESWIRLYGAYYDKRLLQAHRTPVVRMLGVTNQINMLTKTNPTFCQIWFETTTKPTIVPIFEYQPIWQAFFQNSTNKLIPVMISCALPASMAKAVPKAISLVGRPCENAGNLLKVYHDDPKLSSSGKQTLSICANSFGSHALTDLSSNLIAWLELLRLIGVDRVDFSIYDLHKKVGKVLHFYENLDFVSTRFTSISDRAVALPVLQHLLLKYDSNIRRLSEAIIANDCFYRNLYNFDFVTFLNIDAVPLPLGNFNIWPEVLSYAKTKATCQNLSRICFRNHPQKLNEQTFRTDGVLEYFKELILEKNSQNAFVDQRTCWHSTKNLVFIDKEVHTRSSECTYELDDSIAQLLYHDEKFEHTDGAESNSSRLKELYTAAKPKIEEIKTELGLNRKHEFQNNFFKNIWAH